MDFKGQSISHQVSGLCVVFFFTKSLYCLALERSKSILSRGALFQSGGDGCMSIFKGRTSFINHCSVCVNTARKWREYV